jgi:CelD/BcsL family acetyltransferase involved in cellulose biosynthesis
MIVQLGEEGIDALREEWSELALRTANIFATWEWASTWWRHFGSGHRQLVMTCRSSDGRLLGVLPFYVWMFGPLPIIRFIGHGPGDQLGPIHAPEHLELIASATSEALACARWGIFVGEHLPATASWSNRLGGRVIAREGSPVLQVPTGGWRGFLAGCSANLRQQIRRRERNLERHHDIAFHLVQDQGELSAALDTLFHLHRLRWPPGTSAFEPRAAFHRDFATVALEREWLRLWLLEVDGRTVAAWYGLRFRGTECYYQAGRDPALDDRSVGFVLLVHSIRQALEDGVHEYRFLRGREPFKYRFANKDPGLETIALTRGVMARIALSTVRLAYPYTKDRIGGLRWKVT